MSSLPRTLQRLTRVLAPLLTLVLAPGGTASAKAPAPGSLPANFRPPAVTARADAVFVDGAPVLLKNPSEPMPTASTVKILTAYVILVDRPFSLQKTVRITAQEAAAAKAGLAQDDWEMPVTAGETFTGWQLLDAALIRSYDNAADMLAAETPGGTAAFVRLMNAAAAKLGLTHTHAVDPSGLSALDHTSAEDMVLLAEKAMAIPAFRQIVGSPTVTLPYLGRLPNVNHLFLVSSDVTGIKTGWTNQAGPCIVFSASRQIDGRTVTVVGALYHDTTWTALYNDAMALIDASFAAAGRTFQETTRIAFVTQLAKALGLSPVTPAAASFDDVPPTDPDYGYVEAALRAGWLKGLPGHVLGARQPITRAQAAKMEVMAFGAQSAALKLAAHTAPFGDAAQIPPWARGYVAEAAQLGLFRGFPDGTFRPETPFTPATDADALAQFEVAFASRKPGLSAGQPSAASS